MLHNVYNKFNKKWNPLMILESINKHKCRIMVAETEEGTHRGLQKFW